MPDDDSAQSKHNHSWRIFHEEYLRKEQHHLFSRGRIDLRTVIQPVSLFTLLSPYPLLGGNRTGWLYDRTFTWPFECSANSQHVNWLSYKLFLYNMNSPAGWNKQRWEGSLLLSTYSWCTLRENKPIDTSLKMQNVEPPLWLLWTLRTSVRPSLLWWWILRRHSFSTGIPIGRGSCLFVWCNRKWPGKYKKKGEGMN